MAWSRLQSASGSATSSTTVAKAFTTANLTSGTVLLAAVSCYAASTSGVSDGNGHSFTEIGNVLLGGSQSNGETSLWMLATPAGDVGTKPTITATLNATSAGVSMLIQEVSGIQAAADGTAGTATQAAGTNASPSYSSTALNEYLVAVGGDNGGPETMAQLGSGYTSDASNLNNSGTANILISYKNSTNGAESDGWSSGVSSGTYVGAILVAFKLTGAASAAPPPYLSQNSGMF